MNAEDIYIIVGVTLTLMLIGFGLWYSRRNHEKTRNIVKDTFNNPVYEDPNSSPRAVGPNSSPRAVGPNSSQRVIGSPKKRKTGKKSKK